MGDHNLVVALVMLFQNPGRRVPSQDIAFSQLLNEVDQGHGREVTIVGNEISGHFTDNRGFATYTPNDPTLVQSLYKKNVSITAKPPVEGTNWLMTLLVNGLPLIAIKWLFSIRPIEVKRFQAICDCDVCCHSRILSSLRDRLFGSKVMRGPHES